MDLESARRVFLDEIIASPDDDDPRLIYADWLEEQGDPRGEFIRVQCELARTERLDPAWYDLTERSEELLEIHGDVWAQELKQDVRKIEFHRGFIDTITVRAKTFLKQADALFQAAPVHWLRFNYVKGVGAALAEMPELSRVRSLSFSGLTMPHEDMKALLASSHLNSIEELDLDGFRQSLDYDMGETLSNAPLASSLRQLNVGGSQVESEFFHGLAQGQEFSSLHELRIGSSDIDLVGVGGMRTPELRSLHVSKDLRIEEFHAFAQLPLNQIEQLCLQHATNDADGMQVLADAGGLDNVCDLNLFNCRINAAALRAIFRGTQLSMCRKLRLLNAPRHWEENPLPELIPTVTRHTPLNGIEELTIGPLKGYEVRMLATSEHLQSVASLSLYHSVFDPKAAQVFADSRMAASLVQLNLIGLGTGPSSAEILCSNEYPNLLSLKVSASGYHGQEKLILKMIQSGAFRHLRSLTLDYNSLSDETLIAIAESSHFEQLRELSFCGNSATQDVVRSVLVSERLPNLRFLDLGGTTGMSNRPKLVREFGKRIRT